MSDHPVDGDLSAFLDGELEAQPRAAVEAHLRQCAGCARHLEELAAVDTLARSLPLEAPAGYFEALPGRVVHRLPRPAARTRRIPAWTWAVAAGLTVAVLGPLVVQERGPEPGAPAAPPVTAGTGLAQDAVRPVAPVLAPAPQVTAPPTTVSPGRDAGRLDALRSIGRRDEAPARAARAEGAPVDKEGRDHADTFAQAPAAPGPAPASGGPKPAPREYARPPAAPPLAAQEAPPPLSEPEPDRKVAGEMVASETARPEARPDEALAVARKAEAERKQARQRAAAGPPMASGARRTASPAEAQFDELSARAASSVEDARALRESWRSYARLHAREPWADEARVRLVEVGADAYRRSREARDLAVLRQDARAYLRGTDAPQAERVHKALEGIPLEP